MQELLLMEGMTKSYLMLHQKLSIAKDLTVAQNMFLGRTCEEADGKLEYR